MARSLVWSPEAIEDIEAIAAYIERDSPWYAKAVATKIVEVAESIPEYPELGRIVPEIGELTIRERLVHRYRVIYRLDEGRILVAAVIHGRQDFEPFVARVQGTGTPNL
jgi:plasmid stabilization system protein ParE